MSFSRFLCVDFPKNSREILMVSPCTDPLPSIKSDGRGGGGVCTQLAIKLWLQKGIALLTLPVNLPTLHVTYIVYYIYGFTQISSEACRLRLNINHWLIKNNIRINHQIYARMKEAGDVTSSD